MSRAAVVDVEDFPSLDVRDCPFDAVSDLVDGCVEVLLPVEEFRCGGFRMGVSMPFPM